MSRSFLFGISVVAHLALGVGLGKLQPSKSHAATAIAIANVPKKEKAKPKPPVPAKVDPDPPKKKAPPEARKVAAPTPAPAENTPPPPPTNAHAMADALPDFGLSLSGGVGGDGVALPEGSPHGSQAPVAKAGAPVKKALTAAPALAGASDCEEPLVKPKPRGAIAQPAYTAAAQAASIEGKVRLKVTVDENGNVVDVAVIAGLGYGLDEAAVAAARAAQFEPATQCGKKIRATFNISMRFGLS